MVEWRGAVGFVLGKLLAATGRNSDAVIRLGHAAITGDVALADWHISRGADVNGRLGPLAATALHMAAIGN